MSKEPYAAVFNNRLTLPLYTVQVQLLQELEAFGKASATILDTDPNYKEPDYKEEIKHLSAMMADWNKALAIVSSWNEHLFKYSYFIQFLDDSSRDKVRSLNQHTALASTLIDNRLGLDSAPLWRSFDTINVAATIHSQYREDKEGVFKYRIYKERLDSVMDRYSPIQRDCMRLVQRAQTAIRLKADKWATLPSLLIPEVPVAPAASSTKPERAEPIKVFYSYSHADEKLLNKLQEHLSSLRHEGLIEQWHDRKISAGTEWEGQIDANLENANLILLLISSSFIASPYCHDVEVKRALEKHENGSARVVPIVLRDCLWLNLPFGKLQALPKDAKSIKSRRNVDSAFTEVAQGLRNVVGELRVVTKV